jgi:hypothetical protein
MPKEDFKVYSLNKKELINSLMQHNIVKNINSRVLGPRAPAEMLALFFQLGKADKQIKMQGAIYDGAVSTNAEQFQVDDLPIYVGGSCSVYPRVDRSDVVVSLRYGPIVAEGDVFLRRITDLKGAPLYVGGDLRIVDAQSLEGAPLYVRGSIIIDSLTKDLSYLKPLENTFCEKDLIIGEASNSSPEEVYSRDVCDHISNMLPLVQGSVLDIAHIPDEDYDDEE